MSVELNYKIQQFGICSLIQEICGYCYCRPNVNSTRQPISKNSKLANDGLGLVGQLGLDQTGNDGKHVLRPKMFIKFRVSFEPGVPDMNYADVFLLWAQDMPIRHEFRGLSKGPSICFSENVLNFDGQYYKDESESPFWLKMQNNSGCNAQFQFDNDNLLSIFMICPTTKIMVDGLRTNNNTESVMEQKQGKINSSSDKSKGKVVGTEMEKEPSFFRSNNSLAQFELCLIIFMCFLKTVAADVMESIRKFEPLMILVAVIFVVVFGFIGLVVYIWSVCCSGNRDTPLKKLWRSIKKGWTWIGRMFCKACRHKCRKNYSNCEDDVDESAFFDCPSLQKLNYAGSGLFPPIVVVHQATSTTSLILTKNEGVQVQTLQVIVKVYEGDQYGGM